jgi:Fe-S oxidoreductase/nitrate reductase gamma subunit
MNNAMEATREIYWNVTGHNWLYLLLVPTLAIAFFGLWRKIRLWRAGTGQMRFDRIGERIDLFLENAAGQRRTARSVFAALFHTGLYAGFIVLTIATTVVAIEEHAHKMPFHLSIMKGWFYLIFQSLIVDLFGMWVLVASVAFAFRRLRTKPRQLVYTREALILLGLIFLMALQGFLLEGWRIAVTDDPWGIWSPVGWTVAMISDAVMSDAVMMRLHNWSWWFHLVTAFGFIAYAPYTKMAHAVTAPLNIFTANLDGYGASLKTIDFETAPVLGVNSLEQFTFNDLLDLDACTECGRCTAVCPANTVGKELSPRDIILDLRTLMHQSSDQLLALAAARRAGGEAPQPGSEPTAAAIPIVRDDHAVSETALFQCTTCAACMEACPVMIEQMPKIVDARRFLVMEQAEFPEGMMKVVTSMESRQHPYVGTQFTRTDWAEGLDIPVMAEMDNPDDAEVLFWVGCGGALVERNHSTVQATAKLLQRAGVPFSILGREESCTGDPARRIGNEFLFEMLAKGNIDTLGRYGVKKIVTSCPHCFNTFANEYPNYGGKYEVYHHSEYLAKLVGEGALTPKPQGDKVVTFHDPCYLGRHNGHYDEPREIVEATSRHAVEMEKSRNNSFCCGGGGGMAFVDEPPDKRVNQERAQQALDTGADVVAVGCPFCATMLEDGIGARKGDREVSVMDIAEMLLEATD